MLTLSLPSEANPVLFYESRHYMFSNFSSFQVFLWARWWQTSEHAYQAAKFTDSCRQMEIAATRSAHDAKKLARSWDEFKRADWDETKLDVMETILRAKLKCHSFIGERLLETGTRTLIEDSPRDSFWGRGPNWRGENHLGKLWMKLRDELRAAQPVA